MRDVFAEKPQHFPKRSETALKSTTKEPWKCFLRTHAYNAPEGFPVALKHVYRVGEGKQAVWEYIVNGQAVKAKSLSDEIKTDLKKIPLYGLERLVNSKSNTLYIVEGEKDVDTLSRLGYSAAC
jgi:hypothetical protein